LRSCLLLKQESVALAIREAYLNKHSIPEESQRKFR